MLDARLRPHRQHRLGGHGAAFLEVAAYSASKAGVVVADPVAGGRVGAAAASASTPSPRACSARALNAALLDGTRRGQELLMRTPMKRFGQPEEVAGGGGVPRLGGGQLRQRRGAGRRRRLPTPAGSTNEDRRRQGHRLLPGAQLRHAQAHHRGRRPRARRRHAQRPRAGGRGLSRRSTWSRC